MSFRLAAHTALQDPQLRANLRHATSTIRTRRAAAIAELGDDWERLREQAAAVKARTLSDLDSYLEQFSDSFERAGGVVHWARSAEEANRIVCSLIEAHSAREVLKVKSLTTDEIGLNQALATAGIQAIESDLAELIVQLAGDRPSHILVPAIHRNRRQIKLLLQEHLGLEDLDEDPRALTAAVRDYLRDRFLSMRVAVSGANFGIAETGTLCVVESEGNGRMCLTLPEVLITVMGIEKLVPRWHDIGPMLRLLPRSATGERMNPYTTMWTGVHPGDGPQQVHVVLLDAGRSLALADPVGRDALRCIRCSACLNVCPVYEQVGGHAYESNYPGPIGAILAPQLSGMREHADLPWASSLCGACAEVCPVKIDIPALLLHLRRRAVRERRAGGGGERVAMKMLGRVFDDPALYERMQRAASLGRGPLRHLPRIGPAGAWGAARDLPAVPPQSFREWWRSRT